MGFSTQGIIILLCLGVGAAVFGWPLLQRRLDDKDDVDPSVERLPQGTWLVIEGMSNRKVRMTARSKQHALFFSEDVVRKDAFNKPIPVPLGPVFWEGEQQNVFPANPSEIHPKVFIWKALPEQIDPQTVLAIERNVEISERYANPTVKNTDAFQERKKLSELDALTEVAKDEQIISATATQAELSKQMGVVIDNVAQPLAKLMPNFGPGGPMTPKK